MLLTAYFIHKVLCHRPIITVQALLSQHLTLRLYFCTVGGSGDMSSISLYASAWRRYGENKADLGESTRGSGSADGSKFSDMSEFHLEVQPPVLSAKQSFVRSNSETKWALMVKCMPSLFFLFHYHL